MTDTELPRYCITTPHTWSEPRPTWVFNAAVALVEHPTLAKRMCTECPAEQTVERTKP